MELLIRRPDRTFVSLARGADCSVFQPPGFKTSLVHGREVGAVALDGSILTFSLEMVGIQVGVAGGLSVATAATFADSVARQLSKSTGQALEVVNYA